jgi:hypothetical protein
MVATCGQLTRENMVNLHFVSLRERENKTLFSENTM